MKKLLLLLLCVPLLLSCVQNKKEEVQEVEEKKYNSIEDSIKGEITKQSVVLDDDYKEFFQKACNRAFSSEKGLKMNHFKDNNSDDFCRCWTEKVFDNFTNTELKKMYNDATSSNANFYEASYQVFTNPVIQKITIDCMQNENFADDSYIDLNPEKLSLFVKQCKDNLKTELGSEDYYNFNLSIDIDDYCECYMTNLIEQFTMDEMMNINQSPVNIAKRDKIQSKCIENHLR